MRGFDSDPLLHSGKSALSRIRGGWIYSEVSNLLKKERGLSDS